MKLAIVLVLSVGFYQIPKAQPLSIIPMPVSAIFGKGQFVLSSNTEIKTEGSGMTHSIEFFNQYLQKIYGFQLSVIKPIQKKNFISINFERMDYAIPGAYRLDINEKRIEIFGDNEEGIFYAIQTLIQLLPTEISTSLNIPAVKIIDHPRFSYRGLHLDVGRHFFDIDFVKKYIDFIALHKMNYFHWHLTEDQGWRIEIKNIQP